MTKRTQYSREFKVEAVRLVTDQSCPVAQVARDLNLHENLLRKWVRESTTTAHQEMSPSKDPASQQAEINRLKKELAKLTMERDIMKKAMAYFARDTL